MLSGRFVEEINYQRFGFNRIYQIAFSPIFNEENILMGVSCYAKDITKRRNIEAQNFENSQLLQTILSNVSIVVFSLDDEGNFKKVVGSGLQKVGFSEEDFKDKNIQDFPNYFHDNLLKSLEESTQTIVFESHFINKGNTWWMENFVFKNPKGGIVGCAIDITENKKVQEQLSEKNLMLEKANKELDRFVYSTSHDLRAPLKSVLGLIKLGKLDVQEPVAHQYFDLIRQNIEKLEDFIQEIIEYSRNTRQEVKSEPIDFDAIFSTVVHRHQYMEGAMQLNFKIEVPSYLKFSSDASRLIIVLNNLVSNAIKYHDFSKPQPFILMKVIDYPTYIEIIIQDNGLGIEKEYQERVFDMFFRATEKSSGSGLGLYITKEIIEKLKGSITLSSEISVGTTMTIKFPK
jgi:PAS domain S-box-containing protein